MSDVTIYVMSIIYCVQYLMAYGIAYRKTQDIGDNGVFLFIWIFVYQLLAFIPGLGIYLWFRSRP